MIPRETIDRIYSTVKIEDVIGDYMSLRRRGANLWGNCPFHDEKTPSFSVSPAKGIYKCFGCGKAGNAVNFVMEYEQCSYADAIRQIAKKYHIEIQEKEMTEEERQQENERESLLKVNEWANHWFQDQLWNTDEGKNIGLTYFLERGLREDIIRKFQLGYSPDRDVLYPVAKKAGYKEEFLDKTGLTGISNKDGRRYDRFHDRVIFPIFSISGKVVGFAGRIMRAKEHTGKYVNSPDSLIFSKQNELYGLFQAKQAIVKQKMMYLVEGQMDVISMFQAGVENVVSSGGTSLTHRQVLLMHRLTENVTILYDGDSAGIKAAVRGIDMMLEQGLNIKVVLLPDGEDPDSFSRKMNAVDFQQYLLDNSQDFIRFKTNLLLQDAGNDPIQRSGVIKNIVQSISVIPDIITRQLYIKECSNMMDIKEDALLNEVKKLRKERYQNNKKTDKAPQKTTATDTADSPDTETPESGRQTETAVLSPDPQAVSTGIGQPQNKLEENIFNLLQVLIKYGDYPLFEGYTVGKYIVEEISANHIQFENPLYDKIFQEYVAHQDDAGFKAEEFFKYHPNSYISSFAVELMSERYELSKIFGRQNISENVRTEVHMPTDADRLSVLVPQLVYELQLTIVKQQQQYVQFAIQHAQENRQEDELHNLLRQNIELKQQEVQLSKLLGNRTLN